jgi:hypothetical protein
MLSMLIADALGHRFPSQRVLSNKPVTLTDADIYGALEPLSIHGPLFTSDLLAFMSLYRDTERYNRDRLGDFYTSTRIRYAGQLVGGPIFDRPLYQFPEQPHTPKRRQQIIHQENDRGDAILKAAGRYHPIKHGGWWDHQVVTGHVTAGIHLGALFDNKPFKPSDMIAPELGVVVPFEIKGTLYDTTLYRPDALFGVDRYFILEIDLGNEVGHATDPKLRKTYERMVLQILALIGSRLYHEKYGIPANKALMALIVSTSQAKIAIIESIILEHTSHLPEPGCNFILLKHIPATAFSAHHSPRPLTRLPRDTEKPPIDLWNDPWKRAGRPDFYINNPKRQ